MPPRRRSLLPVHPPLRAETALAVLLACVIGVVLCIAMVSWMLCSQAPGQALCTLAVTALPVPGPLRRTWLRWRMWRNARRMAETERQINQYLRLLAHDREHLDHLRERLSRQQTRQLVLASEQ